MPTVPVYDSPKVELTSLPNVRADAPVMPDVGDRAGKAITQGMNDIASSTNTFALKLADQANSVRVVDAMNQAMQAKIKWTTDPTAGFVHLKGAQALDPDENGKSMEDRYSESLQGDLDHIASKLGNDAQRREFSLQAAQLKQQFVGSMMEHKSNEYEQHKSDVFGQTIGTALANGMASYGNQADVEQSRNAIKNAVNAMYAGQGETIIAGHLREELAKLNSIVISKAVDGDQMDYANAQYAAAKDRGELTPEADDHLSKMLHIGTTKQQVIDNASQLWADHKGNLDAALADARSKKLNPDVLEGVESRLKVFHSEVIQRREQNESIASDIAWKHVAAGEDVPPSILTAMPGQARISLQEYQNKKAKGELIHTDMAQWLDFTSMPASKLAAMTPTSLMNSYRNVFSDSDMRTANEMIQDAKNKTSGTPGLSVAGSVETQIKEAAEAIGVLPLKTSGYTMEKLENYREFRGRVQDKVSAWEQSHAKKADTEALAGILTQIRKDKVMKDEWGSDPEVTVLSIPTGDRGKYYVTVGNEQVYTSDIPATQRQLILQAAAARGIQPTEQQIIETWVKHGKPR